MVAGSRRVWLSTPRVSCSFAGLTSGMLALPATLAKLGLAGGLFMLVLVPWLGERTTALMVVATELTGGETYTVVAERTRGRAGSFELLMLLCVAAVWGSAALPPSVERHERRAEEAARDGAKRGTGGQEDKGGGGRDANAWAGQHRGGRYGRRNRRGQGRRAGYLLSQNTDRVDRSGSEIGRVVRLASAHSSPSALAKAKTRARVCNY